MTRTATPVLLVVLIGLARPLAANAQQGGTPVDLFALAQQNRDTLTFATLLTAQDVRDRLATEEGLAAAITWCRETAVTHVFIEEFRDGYTAPRDVLERARDRFRAAGIEASGCITTTAMAKRSTGWDLIPCFTNQAVQEQLQQVFEYAAGLFDEIMIDDFLFTDCECDECRAAKGDRTWEEYRSDLMVQVSRDRILGPARAVNPKVKVIIKYPQWYDAFHERGYEVVRETQEFDRIWVGTETRDPDSDQWGRKMQYEAYFIMRWLGEIGGAKCGGGWFDPYGTSPQTYVEQARQTVLGGAREALLFCYGSLLEGNGPENVAALRREVPRLFELARIIRGRQPVGLAMCKPPNSHPDGEAYVFDFIGMLGLPLVPTARLSSDAAGAVFTMHALKDPQAPTTIARMVAAGKPVLVTSRLAAALAGQVDLAAPNVVRLDTDPEDLHDLLGMNQAALDAMRSRLLQPLGITFSAPARVALYVFDGVVAIENFGDQPAAIRLQAPAVRGSRVALVLGAEEPGVSVHGDTCTGSLPARTLVVLTAK